MCLLILKSGFPSHCDVRQVDTIVCCFGAEGGEHRGVRSVLFRDGGSSSQITGPTTQLRYHHLLRLPPAELVRPPGAATATTTDRRTGGGERKPASLEAATLPGCVGRRIFREARVALICDGAGLHGAAIGFPLPPPSTPPPICWIAPSVISARCLIEWAMSHPLRFLVCHCL